MATAVPLYGTGAYFSVTGLGTPASPFILQTSTGAAVASVPVPGTGGNFGVASGKGTPHSPYVLSVAVAGAAAYPLQTASAVLLAQNAALASVVTTTSPAGAASTWMFSCSLSLSVQFLDDLQVRLSCVDENGTARTIIIPIAPGNSGVWASSTPEASATGVWLMPTFLFRVYPSSTITVLTALEASGGGIIYDIAAFLQQIA